MRYPGGDLGRRQRGTALSEMVVLLPLLLAMLLVAIDFGRLVYTTQILVDLTRESGNLVSRGATYDDAFKAASRKTGEVNVLGNGGIIISEVRRKAANDPTPWIMRQERRGAMSSMSSRVGKVGGPAKIPNVTQMPVGAAIMAVEILHPFDPMFESAPLHINFYPESIYEVAFF
jgi:hypothetical protein